MSKKKILIVDDEEDISYSLKEIIESQGCEVFATVKNEEAWEIFNKERPQVCLLDIHMPFSEFDGIELLRRIRSVDKNVICLFLTRIEDDETKETAKALGVNDYFEKPLDGDAFDKLIEYVS